MHTEILKKVEKPYMDKKFPPFSSGDTVSVFTIIKEGDRKRTQVFKGIVIAEKGSGLRKTFTVRKISYGVGVEKIFPLYSPNIEKIELLKKGKVKRSKLYYMRERIGKRALKIRAGKLSEIDKKLVSELKELERLGVIEGKGEEVDGKSEIKPVETKKPQEKIQPEENK